jgi:hypothetical protein
VKWECKKLHWLCEDEVVERINKEGQNGWRPVSIIRFSITEHYDVYLEREIPESPAENPDALAVIGRDEPSYKKANGLPPLPEPPAYDPEYDMGSSPS